MRWPLRDVTGPEGEGAGATCAAEECGAVDWAPGVGASGLRSLAWSARSGLRGQQVVRGAVGARGGGPHTVTLGYAGPTEKARGGPGG